MEEKMATIKDVAADAGVSVGTVSRVLNNLYVKPGNRERVEASIRKLNYRVDTYARGMKAKRTYTAAILVPDLINPFFAMLVNDVEQVLAESGYRLLVCNSHNDAERELSYLNMARQNRVDGLIALTYSNLDEYLEADLPVVSIDRHFPKQGICCVSGDNAEGGRLASRRFIETGCRNVIYLRNGSSLENETLKRGQAFLEACAEVGLPASSRDFGEETTLSQEGIRRIDAFLEESVRDGICEYDGIFASSDVHAVVILKKLRELGVRVPEQVQLIGYDGLRVLNVGDYAVSSIAQPVRRMAMSCVDVLLKLIEKKPVGDSVILPVKFVDGGTTR